MKNIIDLKERLIIWRELLKRPEGVTYKEFCTRCAKIKGYTVDYNDASRQDIKLIKALVKETAAEVKEEKVTGKQVRFFLTSDVDLCLIHERSKVQRPYLEIMELLAKAKGAFPSDYLSELSSIYESLSDAVGDEGKCIFFEADYDLIDSMRFFPIVYKSIRKQGLLVTRHRAHSVDKQFRVHIFPEVLKQYKSAWYVYGVVTDDNGNLLNKSCGRIPLAMIDEIEPLPVKQFPFISSGIDYDEYFDEIIGLENDEHCSLEDVVILVSDNIYERIASNPIHGDQKRSNAYKRKGYKCIQFKVRKNKELIRTLMSYGADIEVMQPLSLRKSIAKEFLRSVKKYEGD